MLKIEEIKKRMERYNYSDSRILSLNISNFSHEVKLVHEDDDGDVIYIFSRCYKVDFNHDLSCAKLEFLDYSNLERAQRPYFIHNIDITAISVNDNEFYQTVIDAWPMTLTIISEDISVYKDRE